MRKLLVAALWLAPVSALAADGIAGKWNTPLGAVDVTQTADGVVGKMSRASKLCPAFAAGAEVLRGALLEGTFAGELRLCLAGKECTAKDSWLSVLLMSDAKNQKLAGAVERGNDACHADLPGKGGVVLSRPGAHVDARSKLKPAAIQQAQALITQGMELVSEGRPEPARARFQAALSVAPLAEAYNGVGVTYYFRRDYPSALAAYQQALAADPDFGDAYYNIACVHALEGDKDTAFKYLRLSARNRFHDFSNLDDDTDLSLLHGDPRYAALKKLAAQDTARFGAGNPDGP